jgi:tRNA (guanine37-N1)-methyltransferase
MVMLAEPLERCLDAIAARAPDARPWVIHVSPRGEPLTHRKVMALRERPWLTLVASRYEGVDERFIARRVDEEVSLGDFVLSGGEVAAMAIMDALIRQLPGALNDADSAAQDSFVNGLLDCPHYTRPEVYAGMRVPEVLLSGDHARIARWRLQQSLGLTRARRPELLRARGLSDVERKLLDTYPDGEAHRDRKGSDRGA